jgi:hypothetical protein
LIQTHLQLCLYHLTESTISQLQTAANRLVRKDETLPGWPYFDIAVCRGGLFVSLPYPTAEQPEPLALLPQDLALVFEFANRLELELLHFHGDHGVVPGLTHYGALPEADEVRDIARAQPLPPNVVVNEDAFVEIDNVDPSGNVVHPWGAYVTARVWISSDQIDALKD